MSAQDLKSKTKAELVGLAAELKIDVDPKAKKIRDRLRAHRADPAMIAAALSGLNVTWAAVHPAYRDGVERYLAEEYRPLIGDRYPNVAPIPVNLPRPVEGLATAAAAVREREAE